MKFYFAVILLLTNTVTFSAEQTEHGWDEDDCKKIEQAAGSYIIAATVATEASGKAKDEGNTEEEESNFDWALKFMEMSENYSTVYATFCQS
jgi:hypothetical protein